MFIQNKYTTWYYDIINKAKSENRVKSKDQYYESHHIIPKSLGGNNTKENLVLLTAREHFIIHWLLTKMVIVENKMKMFFAFYNMSRNNKKQKRNLTSRQFEICKLYNNKIKNKFKTRSVNKGKITVKDKNGNCFHVEKNDTRLISGELQHITKGLKRNWSDQQIKELYASRKGRKYSKEEHEKRKLTRPEIWNKGRTDLIMAEETKRKIGNSNKKPKRKIECPHCNKIGGIPQMKQWHFDNCKSILN